MMNYFFNISTRVCATSSVSFLIIILLTACGGGGGGGSSSDGNDNTVASINIYPSSVLFTTSAQQKTLIATAYNAAGEELDVGSFAWATTNSNAVNVNGSGTATSASTSGSAVITASIDGVTSSPVITIVAQPVSGAVTVEDAQVVGDIALVDPTSTAPFTIGSQYEVTLSGMTAPSINEILIGTGEIPVAGKVVSTREENGQTIVTLEMVTLDELFPSLDFQETIPLTVKDAVFDEGILDNYDVTYNSDGSVTLTPKANITFSKAATTFSSGLSKINCESDMTVIPLQLDSAPTFKITPDQFEYDIVWRSGSSNYKKLAVTGKITVQFENTWSLTSSIDSEVTCTMDVLEFTVPITGVLSWYVGGYIPISIGMTLGGQLDVTEMQLAVDVTAGASMTVGIECPIGSPCGLLADYTSRSDLSTTWTTSETFPESYRLEPSLTGFINANLELGSKFIKSARIEALTSTVGVKMAGILATVDGQIIDTNFASSYELSVDGFIGPGADIVAFMDRFNISLADTGIAYNYNDILSTSPVATSVTTDGVTPIIPGELVNFNVAFAPSTVNYIGKYNIDKVQIYYMPNGSTDSILIESETATSGQTSFTVPWTATFTDDGDGSFYAFVVTSFLPITHFDSIELGEAVPADGSTSSILGGTWASACIPVGPFSVRFTKTFSADSGTFIDFSKSYSDGNCQTLTETNGAGGGTYLVGNTVITASGDQGYEFDITPDNLLGVTLYGSIVLNGTTLYLSNHSAVDSNGDQYLITGTPEDRVLSIDFSNPWIKQ